MQTSPSVAQIDSGMLIVRAHSRLCAIPLSMVIETMRALPIEAIVDAPSFVRGMAVIRGVPTPVVDLGILLGASGSAGERFVTLRGEDRPIALSVDGVSGTSDLAGLTLQALPPLLSELSPDVLEAVGSRGGELLFVLRAAWRLPDELQQRLTAVQAP